jgi:hypothetical protein
MSLKLTSLVGAAIGLVVSAGVLGLMWFGVAGVLNVGDTNLMYVLWPSSIILIGGWRTTVPGIILTIYSVLTNSLMYAALALLLRWCVGLIAKAVPTR